MHQRSKLLMVWWEQMDLEEAASQIQKFQDSVGPLKALIQIHQQSLRTESSVNLQPLFDAFKKQLDTYIFCYETRQEFSQLRESEELVWFAAAYIRASEKLTVAEVKTIFDLIQGQITCNRSVLYRAYFQSALALDPEVLKYVLDRFKNQDCKKFRTGMSFVFKSYLEKPGRQWNKQVEIVLSVFDQINHFSDYAMAYSSYFHQETSTFKKDIALDENFTKALFNWITAMEEYRKHNILHWVFAVWLDLTAESFCKIYNWYLETEPPQEDIDYAHKKFCERYATEYEHSLKQYEGLAEDSRAKVLLEEAKAFRSKYREQKKRQNEAERRLFSESAQQLRNLIKNPYSSSEDE